MTMHWLLAELGERRAIALEKASVTYVHKEFMGTQLTEEDELIRRTADVLEMVCLDLLRDGRPDEKDLPEIRSSAADAFRLLRVLPRPRDPFTDAIACLRMCSLAVIGDMGTDAARLLREASWQDAPLQSYNWGERTWVTITDVWLRLIRKNGWEDRDIVLERIASLREAQKSFEETYLNEDPQQAKSAALELIALYHLAKAAEILAHYITDGVVAGNYQVQQLLDSHFDRVLAVCHFTTSLDLEPMARLLQACSSQLVHNSIWTVTRAVNSRVTQFVRSLVDRGRGTRALFDVLPPQRFALAEKGLLGSSRRAVVVSLPTSSGKTLIAQFRILQALNQFDYERGWVAYLAPTRTLVNQITRQLRRDFSPLGISVERVSPALEVDIVEMSLLQERDTGHEFRVLVTTPEKLDLMLRQGWEEKIGRPLTLVVVDEAHNIQSYQRGLKLELLLATINKECQHAQFLLLTPFIENARQVARWLGGQNSEDVTYSLDWQPNDRIIGIVQATIGEPLRRNSYDYELNLETQHTTRKTLALDHPLPLKKSQDIAPTYSTVSNQGTLAAVTAQALSARGPVIVMHMRPDWVWSLAEQLKIQTNRKPIVSANVRLVQEFLELEYGADFPLIELLVYGIGVHHAGLSDDVRALIEWLFESNELHFLVATTTIAQGVNFPVSGVVMASHQYPDSKKMVVDMPPEDFWNIAGRAGRVGQGSLGAVLLVADSEDKAEKLRGFVSKQTRELNSSLIRLALDAQGELRDLQRIVYTRPEWSSFLQYLVHSYRQLGAPASFVDQIEQVLRGTLGFERLRSEYPRLANELLEGIRLYAAYVMDPGQPLKLVDSTGFSLQSINTVFTHKGGISADSWDSNRLFAHGDTTLQQMMGILLKVPELREDLKDVTGGTDPDGRKLSLIIKDWVSGKSVTEIATLHFTKPGDDRTKAITRCGQNLFGKLAHTAAWGLGALLSITASGLPEEEFTSLSSLPSRVYYGVNSDAAISLRLLGVPRMAAESMAGEMAEVLSQPLPVVRGRLRSLPDSAWKNALGEKQGRVYSQVWRVLAGVD